MRHRLAKKMTALLTAMVLVLCMSVPAIASAAETTFTDVASDAWYAEAVEYVRDNGLMSGTSDTAFSPNTATSRAMLVAILHRQAGSPAPAQAANFSDVIAGSWYDDAVSWALANEVVNGYTDGRFAPNEPLTREQLASILWRYAGSPAVNSGTQAFADQSSISSYAVDAVNWARTNGLVNGKDGNRFDPKGQATRAEAALILRQFVESYDQTKTPDTPSGSETAITITVGDTVIPATLNDSTSARDLISRLPFTASMTRGSVDYYSSMSDPLDFDQSDVHNGWHNGDIGFDGTYLTMFHSGEDTSESSGNQITLGHISDLKLLDGLGSSIQATFALAANSSGDSASDGSISAGTDHKTLVVYYSHSQRTENVARLLQEKTGGDLYQLVPAEPYTGSDNVIAARATEEIESGNLPAFTGSLPDLTQYDTILVGGPVWSYTVSAPILSYLEKTDFAGKTVAPFWTDQGGPGDYAEDFTKAVRGAGRVTEFLQLSHTPSISESDMSARLDAWLESVMN